MGELLGEGSSGDVHTARDHGLDRSIALKVLKPHLAGDPSALGDFLAEARMTAALQHPNVLPVHDLGMTADGRPYFSMDRNRDGSLGDAIAASRPGARDRRIATPNEVVTVFIALCQAIAYAHHQGIVHQDIKPENVCLGAFGEVLLLDWGCAIRLDDGTGPRGQVYGTPLYMSPEQARGEPPAPACDIYCLGASFYQALTLCLPTWSDDPAVFWAKKRTGVIDEAPADRLQGVPRELIGIARKALGARPADRYASAEAMRADLVNYQHGLAVSAHRETLWQRWERWYRFHRQVFWISAIALVAISALAGAWLEEKAKERSSWRASAVPMPEAGGAALTGAWSLVSAGWQDSATTGHRLDDAGFLEHVDGGLVLKAGDGFTDLALDTGRLGDVRVEWEYAALDRPFNLNCFLGADRRSGFTFHIGGFNDARKARVTWKDPDNQLGGRLLAAPLATGVTHRFLMEHEDRHVRLRIDGALIFDILDPADRASVRTTRFGFDTCERNRVRIAKLALWHRPLAERISPLVVGDRLVEGGHGAEAESVYREIASSYPGTAVAEEASYRTAVCALHGGRASEGLALLRAFEAAAPDSALVPYALHERLVAALGAGDASAADRLMSRLCAYAGHPLLPLAFAELCEQRRRTVLVVRQPAYVGDPVYEPGLPARIEATRAELLAWGARVGQAELPESSEEFAAKLLRSLDRNDLILGHVPSDRGLSARALADTGRFQEVLDGYRDQAEAYGAALLATNRQEALLDGSYGEDLALQAAADEGRFDEVYPRYRGRPAAGWMLLAAGRPDQVLRDYQSEPMLLIPALLRSGRIEEAAKLAEAPFQKTLVLMARKRHEEILASYVSDTALLYELALDDLLAGRADDGRGLIRRLAGQFLDAADASMHWTTSFLPAFLACADGRTQEADGLLDAVLTNRRTTAAQSILVRRRVRRGTHRRSRLPRPALPAAGRGTPALRAGSAPPLAARGRACRAALPAGRVPAVVETGSGAHRPEVPGLVHAGGPEVATPGGRGSGACRAGIGPLRRVIPLVRSAFLDDRLDGRP